MKVNAVYHESRIPEHKGNPLIEALPAIKSDKDIIRKLANFPDYNKSETFEEDFLRKVFVNRLEQLRQPLREYIQCFRKVEQALYESYSAKNPFSASTQHYLHYIDYDETPIKPKSGIFRPKGSAFTVIGVSGVGKTEMIKQVLGYFNQKITHENYKGKSLNLTQINWLHVECPDDAGIRTFCHAILDAIDFLLGEETKPERTIGELQLQIVRKVRSCFIGLIVIDDMQNLDIAKSGGDKRLINFILRLINNSGVPFLFCGNPPLDEILQKKFRIARRAESGGYIQMDTLDLETWEKAIVPSIWRYQWTNEKTPLVKELSDKLYDLSQGILDIAIRIYINAQKLVIGTEDERITNDVLENSYRHTCKLTDAGITLLKSGDPYARDVYDDLFLNDDLSWLDGTNKKPEQEETTKNQQNNKKNETRVENGDLNRPQHPEFADQLNILRKQNHILSKEYDKDIIRRAGEQSDSIDELKRAGYIVEDPLNLFS